MFKNKVIDRFIEHIIMLGLVGNLVIPSFKINDFGIGLITICSLILLCFIPLLFVNGKIRINSFAGMYIVILIGMYCSIQYSYMVLGVDESKGDYMELFRYFQILPYLTIGSYIDYGRFEQKLITYSGISILILIVICILEITNLFNLVPIIGTLYSTPVHTEVMLSSSRRIVCTGADPNVGALVTVFFLIISMMYRKKNILTTNFLRGSLFTFIVFTQGRTVLLGTIVAVSFYFFLVSRTNVIRKVLLALLVFFFFISILMIIDVSYIINGLKQAEAGQNDSVNVRLENYINAFIRLKESPLWGWGPAKATHSTIIDSDYALIMQRYGVFGIIFNSLFILFYFYKIVQIRKRKLLLSIDFPNLSLILMILSLFVMATNGLFSGYQSVSIPTIIALGLISLNNYRKAEPS